MPLTLRILTFRNQPVPPAPAVRFTDAGGSIGRSPENALVLDDLVEVLDELPPHLVVGTGADGRMRPDPDTVQQLQERGVTVETLPTGQAVRRFAELDPASTAAAPTPSPRWWCWSRTGRGSWPGC